MRRGATLSEKAATAALAKEKLTVTGFTAKEPPKSTVLVFPAGRFDPAKRGDAEADLRRERPDVERVEIDDAGAAIAWLRAGARSTAPEARAWPESFVVYEVDVPALGGAASPREIHDLLLELEKPIGVSVFRESRRARLYLREPCDRIRDAATERLRARGFSVSRFELASR